MIPEKAMAGIVVATRNTIVNPACSSAVPKRFQTNPRVARYSVTISQTAMTPDSQVAS